MGSNEGVWKLFVCPHFYWFGLENDITKSVDTYCVCKYNWPERSLSYLCRAYDNLYSGQDYTEVRPVIHIGFLDFNLHIDEPEFYATYKLQNVKTHGLYSSKFVLSVVHLNQTKLATEEDKAYGIDYWAKLFKAKTWEEIKVLAENNEYLKETAEALYVANADEIVRQQCRARADAELRERRLEHAIRKLEDKNARLEKENERKDKLVKILADSNRINDLKKSLDDAAYREKMYRELEL